MSSILKALEKVETDLVHQNLQQNGTEPFRRISAASSHGVTKKSQTWKRLGLVFCVVLLAAAGWFFAVHRPDGGQSPSFLAKLLGTEKDVSSEPVASSAGKGDPVRSTKTVPPGSATVTGKKTEAADATANRRPRAPDATPSSPDRSSGENSPFQPKKSVQKDSPDRSPAPEKIASVAERQGLPADVPRPGDLPVPATGTRRAENKNDSSEIPIMRAPELKLHAIAWSPDPARRMAVINNSITREGETVDGFSVVRIAQDEIVVRQGQEQWRLMLR